MATLIEHRPYIPEIVKDAKKIGITRQYLSLILHNEEKYEGHWVLEAYKELKENEAAVAG